MSIFRDIDYEDAEAAELRAEDRATRRRAARMNHWCEECHGHTGPGSPCHQEEDEPEDEQQDEEACGKELP